jgi:hypothetical protein
MALDITKGKTAPAAAAAPEPVRKVALCLAIYQRYHRAGQLFEAGIPYNFTEEQAETLLEEVEDGSENPIWKRYKRKSEVQRVQVEANGDLIPVDMTASVVKELGAVDENAPSKRIEIGDDSELAEILGPDGAAEAGVSV